MSRPANVEFVLYDLGGVLLELKPDDRIGCFQELLGVAPEQCQRFLDSDIPTRFNAGLIDSYEFHALAEEFFQKRLKTMELRYCWNQFIGEIRRESLGEVWAMWNLYEVGLLTNTDPWHWACVQHRNGEMLHGFHHYFLSYEIGLTKPDHRIYQYVAKTLDATPDEIVFVDDSRSNLNAARKVGYGTFNYTEPFDLVMMSINLLAK